MAWSLGNWTFFLCCATCKASTCKTVDQARIRARQSIKLESVRDRRSCSSPCETVDQARVRARQTIKLEYVQGGRSSPIKLAMPNSSHAAVLSYQASHHKLATNFFVLFPVCLCIFSKCSVDVLHSHRMTTQCSNNIKYKSLCLRLQIAFAATRSVDTCLGLTWL